jgi:hypothetical protein
MSSVLQQFNLDLFLQDSASGVVRLEPPAMDLTRWVDNRFYFNSLGISRQKLASQASPGTSDGGHCWQGTGLSMITSAVDGGS